MRLSSAEDWEGRLALGLHSSSPRLLSGFILASGKSPVSWQARQILLSACCGPARCPGLPSALGDIQLVSVKRRSQCLAAAGTETGWSYMAVESLFKRVFFFIQLLFSNIQCSL